MSKIMANTPKVPILLSFIISSILSFGLLEKNPSQVSARPSICNPPVTKIIENTDKKAAINLSNFKNNQYIINAIKDMKIPTYGKNIVLLEITSLSNLISKGMGSLVKNCKANINPRIILILWVSHKLPYIPDHLVGLPID